MSHILSPFFLSAVKDIGASLSSKMEKIEAQKDDQLLQTLEQQTDCDGHRLVKFDGYWCPLMAFQPALSLQKYFKAKDSDVLLTSNPKSGTSWLMALTFSIANRTKFPIHQSPLLTSHPHKVVPLLEFSHYLHQENPNLEHLSTPRILATHVPFHVLADSVLQSECKIIYICRNPLDQFISYRQFFLENKIKTETFPHEMDESFDLFCRGIHPFGPFWDHILGYWNAHLENPKKVLFLRYEDLKEDTGFHVRKIAEFLGYPFSEEEEEGGLVEEISMLCSIGNLKNLEVNKKGYSTGFLKSSSFFRKGEVGDWMNYLTPAMAERVEKLVQRKFQGSPDLLFKKYIKRSC